ncbi:MAG TPA: GNAT family protein [Candidatus Eremiobacteraeota bacterium]|nr:MAG: Spermidine N(1)-acetyltransferase [bacterium ADurb.Bin363]HPZ06637.1 GNAT family protein [Candidatus Eremiobacteraeota bacterium]
MIFGKKCCLRRPEIEDYARIWAWWNDEELQYLSNLYWFPPGFEAVEECYNRSLSDVTKEYFIIHAFDKNTIGTIDLYNIRWRDRTTNIGIMIGEKDYWGKGYGADAIMSLMKFVFNELDLRRIELKVVEYNLRAIRCYEKCGFKKEGCLRKKVLWNGKYYDQYIMAILKEEFII